MIVAYGNQIAMEATLEQSLARIFGGRPTPQAGAAPAQATETPSDSAAGTRQLGQRAWEIWTRAQDALRRGDWATYGAEQKRLEETLARADAIEVGEESPTGMPNLLVTAAFGEAQLDRLRRISPRLTVTRSDPDTADYSRAEILYGVVLPRDRSRAPNLKWIQVHMAGVNGLHQHPLYADAALALTTASGVHAATVAEYAMTALLALAHRVPRMVEWQGRGVWPPDEQRWPLVRADRGARRNARRHRLRQHRPRARPDRQNRVRHARARVQARSGSARRSRLLPGRHRGPRGPPARRVVLAGGAARAARRVGRGRDVRAAHARDAAHDRRSASSRR